MDKRLAEIILRSVLSLLERFNAVDPIVRQIEDHDERRRLLKSLGMAIAELNAGIVLHIASQFPELDPDLPENADFMNRNVR